MKKNSLPYKNLETILLRMNYDSSKTYTENHDSLKEQRIAGIQMLSTPAVIDNKDKSQEYPNYCKYPKLAVDVSQDVADAYTDSETGLKYCKYTRPQYKVENSVKVGIWIPSDSEIAFSTYEFLANYSNSIFEKYHQGTNTTKKKIINNLVRIFPLDTVVRFKSSIGNYNAVIQLDKVGSMKDEQWIFMGYRLEGSQTKWYEEPEDTRTQMEIFADNFSWWKQLAVAILATWIGSYLGGATWGIAMEIFVNLGIGALVAWREWTKGQNIGMAMSIILSLLPFAQLRKSYRGINQTVLNELIEDLSKVELKTTDDVINYYNSISNSPEKQKAFTQIFSSDDLTKKELETALREVIQDPKAFTKFVSSQVRGNKDKFYDIKFWKTVTGKDLKWVGVIFLADIAAEQILGRYLNDEEKRKLEEMYVKIPDSHKLEFLRNIVSKEGLIDVMYERSKKVSKDRKVKMEKWAEDNQKYLLGKENYVEDPEDPEKGSDEIPDTIENEKKYRTLGYKLVEELKDNESMSSDNIWLGTRLFTKPIKN